MSRSPVSVLWWYQTEKILSMSLMILTLYCQQYLILNGSNWYKVLCVIFTQGWQYNALLKTLHYSLPEKKIILQAPHWVPFSSSLSFFLPFFHSFFRLCRCLYCNHRHLNNNSDGKEWNTVFLNYQLQSAPLKLSLTCFLQLRDRHLWPFSRTKVLIILLIVEILTQLLFNLNFHIN